MICIGSARRGSFCSADRTCSASRPAVLLLPITAPLLLRAYSVTRVCFCREMAFLQVVCVISVSFRLGCLSLLYCGLLHIIRNVCRRACIIISSFTTCGKRRDEILYIIHYSWLNILHIISRQPVMFSYTFLV
jgi:hypothetical protein